MLVQVSSVMRVCCIPAAVATAWAVAGMPLQGSVCHLCRVANAVAMAHAISPLLLTRIFIVGV